MSHWRDDRDHAWGDRVICIESSGKSFNSIHTFCKYHLLYISILSFALEIVKYWSGREYFQPNSKEIRVLSLARVIRFFSFFNSISTGFSSRFFPLKLSYLSKSVTYRRYVSWLWYSNWNCYEPCACILLTVLTRQTIMQPVIYFISCSLQFELFFRRVLSIWSRRIMFNNCQIIMFETFNDIKSCHFSILYIIKY